MATIASIVRNRKGSAGSGNAWTVSTTEEVRSDLTGEVVEQTYVLRHYSTIMLTWRENQVEGIKVEYMGTGRGSVSDQGGMNTAFKVLGLPYYFGRKGGAEIYAPAGSY